MRKMDEMEKMITLKSIRFSWVFTGVFLLVWGILNYIKGQGETLPMVLFTLQVLVVIIFQRILAMKAGDNEGKSHLIIIFFTMALVVMGGLLLYFLN